jgi:hypothetical protein
MKKSKFTVAENLEILKAWQEIQEFSLKHPALDKDGKPLPNPLIDELYIAGTHAAKALQQPVAMASGARVAARRGLTT